MSSFGLYRTRTFGQIFPDSTSFSAFYNANPVPARLMSGVDYATYDISVIYGLLVSEFFASHIAFSSEDWFKMKLMQIIYEYGPAWQREMALQDKLMKLSDTDLVTGAKAIHNHAAHPSTAPATATLDEVEYIDDQSTTNWKKEKLKAYMDARNVIDDSVTREFISRFKKLFVRFIYADDPVEYEYGGN